MFTWDRPAEKWEETIRPIVPGLDLPGGPGHFLKKKKTTKSYFVLENFPLVEKNMNLIINFFRREGGQKFLSQGPYYLLADLIRDGVSISEKVLSVLCASQYFIEKIILKATIMFSWQNRS